MRVLFRSLLRAGQCDEANVETGRALRMSPVDDFSGFYTSVHGLALLAARRFGEALPFLRASVAAFPDYSGHYNSLISCCGHLGLMEEAQEFAAVRSRMNPPLSLGLVRRHLAKFAHCDVFRSEEHTSELQSLMRISYAVFCLKQKTIDITTTP